MSDLVKQTPKSFLARPEGTVGLGVTMALGGVALFGAYRALPYLITFATNVVHLGALCALIGAAGYLVLDQRARAFGSYLYRALFRAITGFFIELDPIGILRNHIVELQKKLANMREQMGSLSGQVKQIERIIQENEQMRDDALRLAHAGRNDPSAANMGRLQARNAIKLEDSNKNLSALLLQMQTLFRMLRKLYDAAELVLQDMQSTVGIKTRERASMTAAYSAYRSAFAILQGASEGDELYDRAMEFVNEEYARKLGEIEIFMDFSEGVIKATDLQNMAYDARAVEKLHDWERRLDESLLDTTEIDGALQTGEANASGTLPAHRTES
jgi:hypothetical protein